MLSNGSFGRCDQLWETSYDKSSLLGILAKDSVSENVITDARNSEKFGGYVEGKKEIIITIRPWKSTLLVILVFERKNETIKMKWKRNLFD